MVIDGCDEACNRDLEAMGVGRCSGATFLRRDADVHKWLQLESDQTCSPASTSGCGVMADIAVAGPPRSPGGFSPNSRGAKIRRLRKPSVRTLRETTFFAGGKTKKRASPKLLTGSGHDSAATTTFHKQRKRGNFRPVGPWLSNAPAEPWARWDALGERERINFGPVRRVHLLSEFRWPGRWKMLAGTRSIKRPVEYNFPDAYKPATADPPPLPARTGEISARCTAHRARSTPRACRAPTGVPARADRRDQRRFPTRLISPRCKRLVEINPPGDWSR